MVDTKHIFAIFAWNISTFLCVNQNCFTKQTNIQGKTCSDNILFVLTNIKNRIECAELCREGCSGVFYSNSSNECHGCKGIYDVNDALATLQDSVYYLKKWHYEYLGCYRDCQNISPCPRRVMEQDVRINSYSLTIEMCTDHCKQYGRKYFGLQNHIACACDDVNYNTDGPADNCDDVCYGNTSQICGGDSANSVYRFVFEC